MIAKKRSEGLCPRYEGVDERIRSMVDLELSIGDYVLTGGELAALVVIDSVIRLLPGAIDEASTAEESFTHGLLEYPQYTRPPSFDGAEVPPILVSGDHGAVRRWRLKESLRRTLERRPDLLVGGTGSSCPGSSSRSRSCWAAGGPTRSCRRQVGHRGEMARLDGNLFIHSGGSIRHGESTPPQKSRCHYQYVTAFWRKADISNVLAHVR